MNLQFYVGISQPADAQHFGLACISISRIAKRVKPIDCDVLIDSGAFMQLLLHGGYPDPVDVYAAQLRRLHTLGVVRIAAAVAQDYMCEPFMLAKTGLTIDEHQRLTIERYDALLTALRTLFGGEPPFPVMPVLQGFAPADYVRHVHMYGDRLTPGMWVGVGSVCKRQGDPALVEDVLYAIKEVRPDLRLHGFRRKADGSAERTCSIAALLGRLDGLELRGAQTGSEWQRLAGGQSFRRPGDDGADRARSTPTVLRWNS
jgi:hypothetical protein